MTGAEEEADPWRDDSQKNKCEGNAKRRSRFPKGMTERNANATATASAIDDVR
jgi:hypothetical protein